MKKYFALLMFLLANDNYTLDYLSYLNPLSSKTSRFCCSVLIGGLIVNKENKRAKEETCKDRNLAKALEQCTQEDVKIIFSDNNFIEAISVQGSLFSFNSHVAFNPILYEKTINSRLLTSNYQERREILIYKIVSHYYNGTKLSKDGKIEYKEYGINFDEFESFLTGIQSGIATYLAFTLLGISFKKLTQKN